ncbi:hypothetical protein [Bradyrhizobium sp. SZCCHNRI3043]|uniref:hypothetical protein n=1 Tax=Bradyrhizobium sp. SZCCHNRI3043 TaxID=3057292 RepID=UPI0028EBAFAC|nr:hypothetical protein [Bradyrhizobium sp. SZCCHNRI3043]
MPLRLLLPQTLCNVLAVADPGFQGIDLGAGMFDREGFGVIDAEPLRALASGFDGGGNVHCGFGSLRVEPKGLGFEAFSLL